MSLWKQENVTLKLTKEESNYLMLLSETWNHSELYPEPKFVYDYEGYGEIGRHSFIKIDKYYCFKMLSRMQEKISWTKTKYTERIVSALIKKLLVKCPHSDEWADFVEKHKSDVFTGIVLRTKKI